VAFLVGHPLHRPLPRSLAAPSPPATAGMVAGAGATSIRLGRMAQAGFLALLLLLLGSLYLMPARDPPPPCRFAAGSALLPPHAGRGLNRVSGSLGSRLPPGESLPYSRMDWEAIPTLPPVVAGGEGDRELTSEKWVVVTTINLPTPAISKLARMPGWRVVVVGDVPTPAEWQHDNCVYLSLAAQRSLGYAVVDQVRRHRESMACFNWPLDWLAWLALAGLAGLAACWLLCSRRQSLAE